MINPKNPILASRDTPKFEDLYFSGAPQDRIELGVGDIKCLAGVCAVYDQNLLANDESWP